MSLIQKQEALVKVLEKEVWGPFFERGGLLFGDQLAGMKAKLTRLHAEALMRDGYTKQEAWESARQCSDVARLNAGHADYMKRMGAPAQAEAVEEIDSAPRGSWLVCNEG